MKTIEQVMMETWDVEKPHELQEKLGTNRAHVVAAMKAYVYEVLDDILTRPDMVYVEIGEGQSFAYGDAVYDYEKWEQYKAKIQQQ